MLTEPQVAFFRTFGFLVLPQAFSPDEMAVIDAEFGGKSGRRMLTLNYTAVPETEAALAFLRQSYASNVTNIRQLGYSDRENSHDDAVLRSDRPRLQRIVAPLLELGFR